MNAKIKTAIKALFAFLFPIIVDVAVDTASDVADRHYSKRFRGRRQPSRRPYVSYASMGSRPRGYAKPSYMDPRPGAFDAFNDDVDQQMQTAKRGDDEERYHDVLLVAFDVRGKNREYVHNQLANMLPQNVAGFQNEELPFEMDAWWIADDTAAGDCDSAVFVEKGQQREARELLKSARLAH